MARKPPPLPPRLSYPPPPRRAYCRPCWTSSIRLQQGVTSPPTSLLTSPQTSLRAAGTTVLRPPRPRRDRGICSPRQPPLDREPDSAHDSQQQQQQQPHRPLPPPPPPAEPPGQPLQPPLLLLATRLLVAAAEGPCERTCSLPPGPICWTHSCPRDRRRLPRPPRRRWRP